MHKCAVTVAMLLGIAIGANGQVVPASQTSSTRPAVAAASPASQPVLPKVNAIEVHVLPVFYAGRVMPLDTMARLVVGKVAGGKAWGKHDPVMLLLSWMWQPGMWRTVPAGLVGDSIARMIRCVPPHGQPGEWLAVASLGPQAGISTAAEGQIQSDWNSLRKAFLAGQSKQVRHDAKQLAAALKSLGSPVWPQENAMVLEVLYNIARPFRIGWVCALGGILAGVLSLVIKDRWQRWVRYLAWGALLNALSWLSLGLVMRWKFLGHAPVTTLYGGLLALGWAVLLACTVWMLVKRSKRPLPAVVTLATLVLLLADVFRLG